MNQKIVVAPFLRFEPLSLIYGTIKILDHDLLVVLYEGSIIFCGFKTVDYDPLAQCQCHFLNSTFKEQALSNDIIDKSSLLLIGTPFQIQVWKTLASLPYGTTCSYQDVAALMQKPTAVRAVARAIAMNSICYFIPCHRVIYQSQEIGNYRWGSNIKKHLLAAEL